MHSVSDPSRVRFTGPLEPLAAGLVAELAVLGYESTSAADQLRLAAHLSRWLQARGLTAGELTGPVIEAFLADRRRDYSSGYSTRALRVLLAYLRRVGAAPAAEDSSVRSSGAGEIVLAEFRRYLLVERAVTVAVADSYVRWRPPTRD